MAEKDLIAVSDGKGWALEDKSENSPTSEKVGRASPASKSQLWREWAAAHQNETAILSDEAISHESIYENVTDNLSHGAIGEHLPVK